MDLTDNGELVKCEEAEVCMMRDGLFLGVRIQLDMEGGGGICWFTPVLDSFDKEKDRRVGTQYGMDFLLQLHTFFGVASLSELRGRMFYAMSDKFGVGVSSDRWTGFQLLGMDGGKTLIFDDIAEEWGVNESH